MFPEKNLAAKITTKITSDSDSRALGSSLIFKRHNARPLKQKSSIRYKSFMAPPQPQQVLRFFSGEPFYTK